MANDKKYKKIEQDDLDFLTDLLFETDMSISQIAREMDVSIGEVNKKINQLGLNWLKNSKKKMSRGQTALTMIMKKLLPGEEIVNEYHIGNKMKLDVYCPRFKLAAEYHGRQHFYYTSRFFESKYEFEEAQKRDEEKAKYCKDNGIALIVFRYNDLLTEKIVYDRMLDAIRSTPLSVANKGNKSITSSSYYQEQKKRNSEYRKKIYRKLKDNRIDDDRKRNF
jgi:very-short-patch-repair endonuclease